MKQWSHKISALVFLLVLTKVQQASAQTNLLINGDFEDINTCTEYKAECGVEAWFYLKDVKAQMLTNETGNVKFGNNSYGIFNKWNGYTDFTPVIGTILSCGLQKGKTYTFKGLISAKLHSKLIFKPGVCIGEYFYVPGRPFSKNLSPDSIVQLRKLPGLAFYEFEYSFIANGKERYVTFGTYIEEDMLMKGRKLATPQTVSIVIDNFMLVPADEKETLCNGYAAHKEKIYAYNYRHRDMDYALYGKGELPVGLSVNDSSFLTVQKLPLPEIKTDTLKLGDVLFDFNKAMLKPAALTTLSKYFSDRDNGSSIDSIFIEGHTDSIGTDQRNLTLSGERCESVKKWMLANDVTEPARIFIHPFGRSRPIATNKTAAGRALNRRVEIVIFRKKEE